MKIVQLTTDNREQQNDYENPVPHFGTAPQALLEGFSMIPGIEVHVVSCVRREVAIPESIFGNIHYHPVLVPKIGWMSSLYSGCIRATRRLLGDIQPDIVHGQGTERDCAMNAVFSGFPNVVTIHGNMAELNRLGETFRGARLYGHLASWLETLALRKTAGVFCNSAYTESLVSPRARKTWRVPNAIRSAFFDKPVVGKRVRDVPLLLCVGHLSPRKRQLEILKAMREIHKQGLRFKLVFIGSAPGNDPYGKAFSQELAKAVELGYADHAGILGQRELVDMMDQAQGFVHFPSEEAFGLVVAEAMARGLKFLGAKLGGIQDIAKGIPGADLCDTFEELQNEISLWILDGAKSPTGTEEAIKEKYAPEVVARRHIEIYNEVLGKGQIQTSNQ